MRVNINFTLDMDVTEWVGDAVDASDPAVVERVSAEVRSHAETVIRDLYRDQGWTTEDDGEYEHLEHLERRESENEIETCCQGRNINCGHHWGRS